MRDLRNRLSEWVALAQEGQEILVTDHGRPVARLVGAGAERPLDRLIRDGAVEPPRMPAEPAGARPRIKVTGSVTDLLPELKV